MGAPVRVASLNPIVPAPEWLDPIPEGFEEEPQSDAGAATPRTYVVAPGDTLSGIAEKALGSHRKYHAIYDANRDVLASPDALKVGMTLRIPDATTL
ncbi:hypothetical protein LzC2_29760 [Planctomycetes bacterium LzC2]|uniref:LysM domain-containing protein n=1 Tax=Alienimonas chondri TaxID=2681879 RepID=A0ABX1VJ64_9PLAN|nr:hypothetical protein [Alienimonas chondri]